MAQKVTPPPPAAEDPSAAEQLAELSPDIRITIAGRDLTIREYEFFEGLEVAHRASGFIAAMHDTCRDGELRYDRIRRLFGVHKEVVIAVAAQAADVDPDWVTSLKRDDKDAFMSAWFGANASFFVREVVVEMREERQRAALVAKAAKRSTGTSSSPAFPAPASEESTLSADSPSAS